MSLKPHPFKLMKVLPNAETIENRGRRSSLSVDKQCWPLQRGHPSTWSRTHRVSLSTYKIASSKHTTDNLLHTTTKRHLQSILSIASLSLIRCCYWTCHILVFPARAYREVRLPEHTTIVLLRTIAIMCERKPQWIEKMSDQRSKGSWKKSI